jgi:hypothetical protein
MDIAWNHETHYSLWYSIPSPFPVRAGAGLHAANHGRGEGRKGEGVVRLRRERTRALLLGVDTCLVPSGA